MRKKIAHWCNPPTWTPDGEIAECFLLPAIGGVWTGGPEWLFLQPVPRPNSLIRRSGAQRLPVCGAASFESSFGEAGDQSDLSKSFIITDEIVSLAS